MSTGLIVILIITAYFAGAALSAPRLMRLVYRDNLAINAQNRQIHEDKMEQWKAAAKSGPPPWTPVSLRAGSDLEAMLEARRFGYCLALAWPISLSFYQFGDNAFKQEIAAQHAKQNAKVISDYEKLLAEKFDKELAAATPADPHVAAARKIIRTLTRKEHP